MVKGLQYDFDKTIYAMWTVNYQELARTWHGTIFITQYEAQKELDTLSNYDMSQTSPLVHLTYIYVYITRDAEKYQSGDTNIPIFGCDLVPLCPEWMMW